MKKKDGSEIESSLSGSFSSENIENSDNKDEKESILKIEENQNKNEIKLNDSDNININNNDSNEDENSDKNLNKINKCNSYNSVFSFANITSKDLNNINLNNISNNNAEENIRASDLSDNKEISIWEAIKQQLSNVKNHIVFNLNIFSGPTNLNLQDKKIPQEIQIFSEKFSKQDEKLINILQKVICVVKLI